MGCWYTNFDSLYKLFLQIPFVNNYSYIKSWSMMVKIDMMFLFIFRTQRTLENRFSWPSLDIKEIINKPLIGLFASFPIATMMSSPIDFREECQSLHLLYILSFHYQWSKNHHVLKHWLSHCTLLQWLYFYSVAVFFLGLQFFTLGTYLLFLVFLG